MIEKRHCYQNINGKEADIPIAYDVTEGYVLKRLGEYNPGYDLRLIRSWCIRHLGYI